MSTVFVEQCHTSANDVVAHLIPVFSLPKEDVGFIVNGRLDDLSWREPTIREGHEHGYNHAQIVLILTLALHHAMCISPNNALQDLAKKIDIRAVTFAAQSHDFQRQVNQHDPEHGELAAAIVQAAIEQNIFDIKQWNISPDSAAKAIQICRYHSRDHNEINKDPKLSKFLELKLLMLADNLALVRYPDHRFLTPEYLDEVFPEMMTLLTYEEKLNLINRVREWNKVNSEHLNSYYSPTSAAIIAASNTGFITQR